MHLQAAPSCGDVTAVRRQAVTVIAIFEQLLQLRYPIEKIRTMDNYPAADDELSMEDNTRCSTPTSTGRVPSNPRTPRHTSTATA